MGPLPRCPLRSDSGSLEVPPFASGKVRTSPRGRGAVGGLVRPLSFFRGSRSDSGTLEGLRFASGKVRPSPRSRGSSDGLGSPLPPGRVPGDVSGNLGASARASGKTPLSPRGRESVGGLAGILSSGRWPGSDSGSLGAALSASRSESPGRFSGTTLGDGGPPRSPRGSRLGSTAGWLSGRRTWYSPSRPARRLSGSSGSCSFSRTAPERRPPSPRLAVSALRRMSTNLSRIEAASC